MLITFTEVREFVEKNTNKSSFQYMQWNSPSELNWVFNTIYDIASHYSALPCRINLKKKRIHYNTIDISDYPNLMKDWHKKLFGKLSFHHSKIYQVMIEK